MGRFGKYGINFRFGVHIGYLYLRLLLLVGDFRFLREFKDLNLRQTLTWFC
jgi:hypothetical protein